MTAPLDLNAVALRKTPTVRFEGPFIGPDKWNRVSAIINGELTCWDDCGTVLGGRSQEFDLTPLQTASKALRCWAKSHGGGTTGIGTNLPSGEGWHEMIERAPADALADAVEAYVRRSNPDTYNIMLSAVLDYRAMYPKEDGN